MSGWIRRKRPSQYEAQARANFLANCFGARSQEIKSKNARNRELWWARFKRNPLTDAGSRA